jgi:hypothetical protein
MGKALWPGGFSLNERIIFMNNKYLRLHAGVVMPVFVLLAGCSSLQIERLNETAQPSLVTGQRIWARAGVEKNQPNANGQPAEINWWSNKIAQVLKRENVFSEVVYPYEKDRAIDLLVRRKTTGKFREGGRAANFFTWWPGPFIFAQSWRGTRFIYDLSADVELLDSQTQKVVGKYHDDRSYEIIHKSGNPFHLLGAALLFPGMIKGALETEPRSRYQSAVLKKGYPEIWKKISASIKADQALSNYLKTRQSNLTK